MRWRASCSCSASRGARRGPATSTSARTGGSVLLAEQDQDQEHDDDAGDEEEDLPEALWILTGDPSGDAVRDHLKHSSAVRVGQHPDRHEDMLEGAAGIRRMDDE